VTAAALPAGSDTQDARDLAAYLGAGTPVLLQMADAPRLPWGGMQLRGIAGCGAAGGLRRGLRADPVG